MWWRRLAMVVTHGVVVTATLVSAAMAEGLAESPQSWVGISSASFVRGDASNWQGADDLSFRYRAGVRGGAFEVEVSVRDDRVVLEGTSASATDHVELWLADGALVAGHRDGLTAFEDARREVLEALGARERSAEEREKVERDLKRADERWRGEGITLAGRIVADPAPLSNDSVLPTQATSRYERTTDGYVLLLELPLGGSLTPTGGEVSEVRYRIDVIDVDDPGAAGPQTSMSSVLSTDQGLATLRVDPQWRLPLDDEMNIARDLEPGGRFELRDGKYRYVTPVYDAMYWGFDGSCCTPSVCLPPRWEPVVLRDESTLDDTDLYAGTEAVLLRTADGRRRIELQGAVPLFESKKEGAYFLVFEVNAASRAGHLYSQCGAGTEVYLAWLELSRSLEEVRRQTVQTASCWHSFEGSYEKSAARLWGETEVYDETQNRITGRVAFSYDNERPERGFEIRSLAPLP